MTIYYVTIWVNTTRNLGAVSARKTRRTIEQYKKGSQNPGWDHLHPQLAEAVRNTPLKEWDEVILVYLNKEEADSAAGLIYDGMKAAGTKNLTRRK